MHGKNSYFYSLKIGKGQEKNILMQLSSASPMSDLLFKHRYSIYPLIVLNLYNHASHLHKV